MAARAARAAAAKQTNAAKRQEKAARRAAAVTAVAPAIMVPISISYPAVAEPSAAAVDRVTRETLNWPGEGAAKQAGASLPVRRSPEAAFYAAGSGRTDAVGVLVDQPVTVLAESTG
jgi:Flp pilus assembly protein TadG